MKLNIRGPVPPDEGASSSASPSGEGSSVSKEKAPEHSSNSGSIDEDISDPEVTQEHEGTTATTTAGEPEPMDIDDLPIKEMKTQLYTCTVMGMDDPDDSPEGKAFANTTKKLERLKKSFKLLFDDDEVFLVPGEAPYFQWEGMVFNENRVSFKTVEDCVERFESVLTAYRVEIEDNWRRILPTGLSGSVAKWYASLGEITLWEEFKTIVIKKYGRSQADTKDEAREKLENLIFRKGLLLTVFLEEFQNLKTAADIKDEDCLVHYLFKTLPKDLSAATKFYINNAASKAEIDINFVISRAVATYEALFKAEWENEEAKRGSDHRGYTGQRGSNFREGQGTKFKRRSTEDGQGGSKNPRLSCKYHPGLTNNYSEADCILPIEVKRNMDKAYKRYGNDVKFCNRCKAPNYKEEGHDCKSEDLAKLNKNSKINNEKRNKSIVPVFTNDNSEDGEHDSESSTTFAALSLKDNKDDCKLDEYDFSQPPKDLLKKHLSILPITLLESSGCIIKTYFMLDTGVSFSCISPILAKKLNVKLNKNDTFGVIKACQRDNDVKRMGFTDDKIKLTYSSRKCSANLEVFNIFSDLHVVVGMDLITQLGITISNLTIDWDDDNNVEIPPIDPDPYTQTISHMAQMKNVRVC